MACLEVDAPNSLHLEYQYRELSEAQAASSDLDYAFELQLKEALAASTGTQFHPESQDKLEEEDEMTVVLKTQALEIKKCMQEVTDHQHAVEEMRHLSLEIHRRSHDAKFSRSIEEMSDDEWEDNGDNYEQPFEGLANKDINSKLYKLYFKGLVSFENMDGKNCWENVAGAGIAIFDPDDNLVMEMAKRLGTDLSRAVAEYMALIEGLKTAFSLGIQNVTAFGDYLQIHNQVIGRWSVRQQKIYHYFQEVKFQIAKLDKFFMHLLPRCDNSLALSLAWKAIHTQLHTQTEYHHQGERPRKENCTICLEDKDVNQMYEIMSCRHRYCLPCMSQLVEVKLRHGCVPTCPFEGCNTTLTVDGCKKFLSSKWIEILQERLKEAAIPESDKVYCPYPNCSALMTKAAVDRSQQACSSSNPFKRTECLKCHRSFCIECRVPWHVNMSCQVFQTCFSKSYGVDAKLHVLANDNRWRRCTQCKHMIELAEGCNHMTCRCGFEFCYVCGAEWKNKKQTCKCVLWYEQNIIQDYR